ncbi:MAG: response regulator [Candidatus Omnitrophota bacterium]|nr:response regulator [Candidatus Omnitrophota bacterium]MBU1928279.1 response regulator [Candidatus Omnitrophota bacterium]MBU2035565.1 response regulator [Candidatus Omnitrophota bacterium]MBU2221798.1 response regulator [Candidatus Omnitrophota bacterium]
MSDKKRILIVDDDETVLQSLKRLLEVSGFEVLALSSARDILRSIKSFKPDIILPDMLMPNLGGLEICQMLNDDKEIQGIPIIMISALSGYADIEKAYKLGVVGYFTKPYDFSKLLQEINKVIASKEGKAI